MTNQKPIKIHGRIVAVVIVLVIVAAAVAGLAIHRAANRTAVNKDLAKGDTLRIAVASDLHYLAPDLTDQGKAFQKTIENADGKITAYSEELVDAFIAQMAEEKPDALILSGDLTFNGEKRSHELLAGKLKKLRDRGIAVYVIPGNHDLNNASAVSFQGGKTQPVATVDEAGFRQIYQDLGYGSRLAHDPTSLSYVVRLCAGVQLSFVDVNGNGTPGTLTKDTQRWLTKNLERAAGRGDRVIGVSHQTVLRHNQVFTAEYVMEGAEELQALYEKYGAWCNLAGHMHIQHVVESEGGVPEVLTSALSITPMHYGMLEVTAKGWDYEARSVDLAGWAKQQGWTELELLAADRYARDFFWQLSYQQGLAAAEAGASGAESSGAADASTGAESSGASDASTGADGAAGVESADPKAMARFFADVNLGYFTGRMDQVQWNSDLAKRWSALDGFLPGYFRSIAGEEGRKYVKYHWRAD